MLIMVVLFLAKIYKKGKFLLKIGKAIPIHKPGDKFAATNYHSVSLCTTRKALAHFLLKHLSGVLKGSKFF